MDGGEWVGGWMRGRVVQHVDVPRTQEEDVPRIKILKVPLID